MAMELPKEIEVAGFDRNSLHNLLTIKNLTKLCNAIDSLISH